jgi:hypothetical protein
MQGISEPQGPNDKALSDLLTTTSNETDTASAVMRVYEPIEQTYRAAVLAGQPASGVSARTDSPAI